MIARLVAVASLAVLLTGCALGPRPTLTGEVQVDDAAIDAVLERLDSASAATFTAVYTITPTIEGASPAIATVAHSALETYTVFTVDGVVSVEYVSTDGEQQTCAVGRSDCVLGPLDESRISNLGVSSSFWGPSTAQKVRVDGGRNLADARPGTETLAGQPATCAEIPVGGLAIAVEYCALDAGPLAAYRGADATIELVSYSPSA